MLDTKIIEEAIAITTERLINFNLKNNGEVTIEEATFLNKLAAEVITEAAEELANEIKNEDDTQETPLSEKVLTDEQGNTYIYNPVTGALDPVDTPTSEDDENTASGVTPELEDNEIEAGEGDEGGEGIEGGEGLMESEELKLEDIAKKLLSL